MFHVHVERAKVTAASNWTRDSAKKEKVGEKTGERSTQDSQWCNRWVMPEVDASTRSVEEVGGRSTSATSTLMERRLQKPTQAHPRQKA